MKTSDKLKMVLCDPNGRVVCGGSNADRDLIQIALNEVESMESAISRQRSEIAGEVEGLIRDFQNSSKGTTYTALIRALVARLREGKG